MAHLRVKVLAKRDGRAYDAAQVEDRPEDTNVKALLALRRICQHERALCSPEQTRTDTQDGTCNDDEGTSMWVDVDGAARHSAELVERMQRQTHR